MLNIVMELDGFLAGPIAGVRDPFFVGDLRAGLEKFLVHEIPALARRHRITTDGYTFTVLTDRFGWPVIGGVQVLVSMLGHGITQEKRNRQIEKAISYWCHSNGLPQNIQVIDWGAVENDPGDNLYILKNKILPTSTVAQAPEEKAFESDIIKRALELMDLRICKGDTDVVIMEESTNGVDHVPDVRGGDHNNDVGVQADGGPSGQPGQLHEPESGHNSNDHQDGGSPATVPVRHPSDRSGEPAGSGMGGLRGASEDDASTSGPSEREPQQQESSIGDGERDTGNRLAEGATSSTADSGQPEGADNVEAGSSGDQGGCDLPDQPAP